MRNRFISLEEEGQARRYPIAVGRQALASIDRRRYPAKARMACWTPTQNAAHSSRKFADPLHAA
jgi:lipoprotein-anchoring transpeptidase ErfK/SrfK